MTSFQQFSQDMDALINTKSKSNFLMEKINKAISEVFRDNGLHVKSIKLYTDSFLCLVTVSEIDFKTLEKIQEYFENYELFIRTANSDFMFEFKKCYLLIYFPQNKINNPYNGVEGATPSTPHRPSFYLLMGIRI